MRLSQCSCFKAKSSSFLGASSTVQNLPQANYQGNKTFKGIALRVVKFVSETLQGSCFKVLYERSKKPALFEEERNAKLQRELRANHAKRVNVENQ